MEVQLNVIRTEIITAAQNGVSVDSHLNTVTVQTASIIEKIVL